MSDIVEQLRSYGDDERQHFREARATLGSLLRDAADEITRLRNELHIAQVWSARIIAGTQQDVIEIARLRAENEKLRAALHEAADELDGYYRAEYPGDHPYSKRKLADAMRDNPARIALEETV